jgi:hypothetical protein
MRKVLASSTIVAVGLVLAGCFADARPPTDIPSPHSEADESTPSVAFAVPAEAPDELARVVLDHGVVSTVMKEAGIAGARFAVDAGCIAPEGSPTRIVYRVVDADGDRLLEGTVECGGAGTLDTWDGPTSWPVQIEFVTTGTATAAFARVVPAR